MRVVVAFVFLIASVRALPELENSNVAEGRNFVTDQITDAINDFSQSIKDAGMDPLTIDSVTREIALPVPVIFNAVAYIVDVLSFGLSDIRINRLSYNYLTFRLNFDLELPHVHLSAGDVFGEMTVFGEKLSANVAGSVDINNIRVVGQVRISIISGISVRNISINFTLRSIYSHLRLIIQDHDLSNYINNFLGHTVPDTLLAYRENIDELLEILLYDVINAYFSQIMSYT